MDVVARETRFVTGRQRRDGGAGDSSVLTAWGVFQGMRAAAEHQWGTASLAGRRVGVAGVGKVGRHLVEHLVDDGAEVVVTDVNAGRGRRGARHAPAGRTGRRRRRPGPHSDMDVYAPCALGGALSTTTTVAVLAARSSPAPPTTSWPTPGVEKILADRGILYAPDYVVNSGGVIQVADEIEGFNFERAKMQGDGDLRHHPEHLRGCRRARASHLRLRPIGWPSGGWPRSVGCAESWSPAVTVEASPAANVPARRRAAAADGPRSFRCPGDLRRVTGAAPVTRRGTSRPRVVAWCHDDDHTVGPPRAGRPFVLCEGVEPWGAAVPRLSSRRWPVR